MYIEKKYTLNDTEITLSTGKLATLAAGSITVTSGGTTVLATVTVSKKDSEQDFFPLSVEYIEKMYARGAISGSRFQKREGFPSEEAIIKARQVDHSIRSLFPKGFRKATAVVLTVLSYDEINDPEVLAVLGASTALMIAGVPYFGPSSSVVACVDQQENIVINPPVHQRQDYLSEIVVSGVDDKFLNIEGWAKEISNETMENLLKKSMETIKEMNQIQRNFFKEIKGSNYSIEMKAELELPTSPELLQYIKDNFYQDIKSALFVNEKADRTQNLSDMKVRIHEQYNSDKEGEEKVSEFEFHLGVEYVARKIVREEVLKNDARVSDRGLQEIRELKAEIDLIPVVHGSALFSRGLTQSLSIVTLGALSDSQELDDMEGESTKRFMHHYNFPPFSTGESGRYSYKPGRREIGHGAIGENALKYMVADEKDFPYTIRVVSEVLTSNGSTSMAATCASSMALMAAGVPMKAAVAGVGVGLVTEDGNEDNFKLLLDIEGIEDFYGDMDFKVTGTENGITAIQYENKLRGVKFDVLSQAFKLAHTGRLQVLEAMSKAISKSKESISPNAPIVERISIEKDQIGELIGPGGKNIREIVQKSLEQFGKAADINIEEDGTVFITAINSDQLNFVKSIIVAQFKKAQVGEIYDATVDKVMPYGVFLNVSNSITGLMHVSEISSVNRNPDMEKIFKHGDIVKVKVSKIENGKINFSMIGVINTPDLINKVDTMVGTNASDNNRSNGNGYRRDGEVRKFNRR